MTTITHRKLPVPSSVSTGFASTRPRCVRPMDTDPFMRLAQWLSVSPGLHSHLLASGTLGSSQTNDRVHTLQPLLSLHVDWKVSIFHNISGDTASTVAGWQGSVHSSLCASCGHWALIQQTFTEKLLGAQELTSLAGRAEGGMMIHSSNLAQTPSRCWERRGGLAGSQQEEGKTRTRGLGKVGMFSSIVCWCKAHNMKMISLPQMCEKTCCLYFYSWITPLHVIFSGSNHVATNDKISFFLWLSSIPLFIYATFSLLIQKKA